jgi:hypothetical protein
MGKRSSFERRPMDFYATPEAAVLPLLPYLPRQTKFCEPCAGEGDLIRHLEKHGHQCASAFDLNPESAHPELDALHLASEHLAGADIIITNPPWSRQILHPMIWRFANLAPTWLLFDADWMFTKQSAPFMDYCQMIVAVGRVKWIEGSKNTGKDNCAWYNFSHPKHLYPEVSKTAFVGRR